MRPDLHTSLRPIARAVAFALLAGIVPAWAGPTGEQVVAGQASVSRSGTNTLVTQGTDRAAINWLNFDIGADESVRFAQPSASSIALNRVLGLNPTEIFGSLTANGQVFILNPNGVLFGKGAQVDVGGLVASTLSLSNEDFMVGRYRFAGSPAAGLGGVANQGDITANGGYVALIGPQVRNEGTITAANGSVALAAGSEVTVNLNGNKLIGLVVNQGTLNALADNKGLIRADGGQVLLTAKAADQIIKSVVNNDGIIEATRLSVVDGVIRLEADNIANSGTLRADGGAAQSGGSITLAAADDITLGTNSIISASGARGGDITAQAQAGTLLADGRIEAVGSEATGGSVKLLGNRVGLINAVSVDASGSTGGGTVLVGGDFQGKNPDVQNAQRTYVGSDATINADATNSGDGGKVIVWANDVTRYYGGISARGGNQSGDGGSVEVSGKGYLDFNGSVNTTAPTGNSGTLLLDPTNINVITGGTATLVQVDQFADADLLGACAAFGGAACSQIAPATINAAAANVTLQATNNILFTNAISITTAGVGITATAQTGNITVNAGITTANRPSAAGAATSGGITLSAGGTVNVNAALTTGTAASTNSTATTGSISITGAGITSNAAGTMTTGLATGGNASNTATSGTITLNPTTGAVTLGAALLTGNATTTANNGGNTTSGNITITNAGSVNVNAGLTTGSSITGNGGTDIGTSGTISITGTSITSNASGSMSTGAATSGGGGTDNAQSGNITLNAGGGAVNLAANLSTGAADALTVTAGSGFSGAINISNTSSISSTATFATGNASGDGNTAGEIATSGSITLASTGAIQLTAANALQTGNALLGRNVGTTSNTATSGDISLTTTGGNILISGTASTGTGSGNTAGISAATGDISLTANAGSITINNNLTTGNPTASDVATTNQTAVSGGITISAGTSVSGTGRLITGNAVLTGAANTGTDSATSGSISVTAGAGGVSGGIGLSSAGNALTTGTASRTTGTGTDTATSGSITLVSRDEINNGTASTALGVTMGAAATAATNNQGTLTATTSQSGGNIFITSPANLTLGAIATAAGSAQTVSIGTTGVATLTVPTAAEVLSGDAVTLSTATGTLTISDTAFDVGAGSLTLQTDGTLTTSGGAGSIKGAGGTVTIQPASAGTSVGIAGAAGTLQVTATNIAALQDGFSQINIGRTDGTGLVTVNAATFTDPLAIRSGGAGGNITVSGLLTDTNNAVNLTAGNAYTQGDFDIVTGTGPITVTANTVALAANTGNNAFQTTGVLTLKPSSAATTMSLAGASTFDLTAAEVTDLAGGVTGAGSIVIGDAAASTGAMTIGAAVNFGAAKTVTLNAGSFTDGNTVRPITAGSLNLNARTGAIGAAGGNNAIDVTVTNLTVNTVNQNAFINSTGAVNLGAGTSALGSGNLTLTAAGAITQSGAVSTTGLLTTTSAGGTTLGGANTVGSFNATNTGAGNISLTNTAAPLTITGITQNTGNVTVSNTGNLVTSGAITTAANGNISLTATTGTETIGAAVTAGGSGTVTLTTTGANDLLVQAAVTSTSGAITATSGNAITESGAGRFGTTGTLTTSSVTGVTLNGANTVGTFNATNSTSGNVVLNDTGGVNITGISNAVGNVTLTNNGAVTQSGAILAVGLELLGAGTYSLTNTGNDVATLAANTGAISYTDSNALSIGTVNATVGISSTGLVDVRTQSGDLTLNNAIATTSTSANAVTLVADVAATPNATGTGGNFINNAGAGAITTGGGAGAWRIYTGNPTGTTRGGLVEAGKRYNVDDGSDPIAAGNRIYFRIQPTLTLTADNRTITYSGTPAFTYTPSGLIDGDLIGAAVSSGPSFAVDGTVSTSGNFTAGTPHNIIPSAATATSLGYTLSYANGALTVTPLALTGTTIGGSTSIYASALVPGAVSFGNVVSTPGPGTDIVTATASVNTNTLSTSGNPIVGSYTQTVAAGTPGGADGANYVISSPVTSGANYTITPLALTGTITSATTTYGQALTPGAANLTNVVSGDIVTPVSTTVDTTGLLSGSNNLIAGSHLGIQKVSALGGADGGNYTFANVLGDYTVNQLVLTGTAIGGGSSIYASALTPGAVSFGNVIAGDIVTRAANVNTTTLSSSGNPIVGSYTQTVAAGTPGGADGANYVISSPVTSAANYTITPLALTGAAISAGSSVYASALTPGAVSFGNVVAGDIVTNAASVNTGAVSSSGNFVAGTYTQSTGALGGADAGNYNFGGFTSAANYTITRLPLTGTAIAAGSSIYASALVPGAVSFGNVATGDLVTNTASVNTSTLSSSGNPIVGSYTQSTGALGGADAANYTLAPFTSAANYTITRLALAGTAIAAGSSVYASALAPGTVSFGNVVAGDLVTSAATVNTGATSTGGNFVAGTYTQSAGALGGADAANYTLAPFTSAANYTISQRALSVSATGVNKTYDTTTSATVTLSDNRIAGDVFADSYASAAFADPNVGVAKPVSVSGINIAGADAGNYTFNTTAVTTANIAPPVSVNPNALAVADSVLVSLYSGEVQLPPRRTVSGPTGEWGQSPGLPSSLPGVQPNGRTASSESSGSESQPQGNASKPGAEPIINGAVRSLVTIVNGGVRMSSRLGGSLRRVSNR